MKEKEQIKIIDLRKAIRVLYERITNDLYESVKKTDELLELLEETNKKLESGEWE